MAEGPTTRRITDKAWCHRAGCGGVIPSLRSANKFSVRALRFLRGPASRRDLCPIEEGGLIVGDSTDLGCTTTGVELSLPSLDCRDVGLEVADGAQEEVDWSCLLARGYLPIKATV
ncbi:hypothetical protein Dimus_022070 [Dionaea muscipula]